MKWNTKSAVVGLILVVIAASSRLLPHWHNFTAVGGVALFSAYFFRNRFWSFAVPLLAMWISDLILNNIVYTAFGEGFVWFSKYLIWSYIGFAAMVLVGRWIIKKGSGRNVLAATVVGTILFFILSNFGAFLMDPMYLKTPSHLWLAYLAGLPFLLNSFLANFFYGGVLFVLHSLTQSEARIMKST